MNRSFGLVCLAIGLTLFLSTRASIPLAAAQRVTLRTDDGVQLAATWYEPEARQGPAVILVHMLLKSRRDWDVFASRLSDAGIGVLTFDLRGHGDSQGTAQNHIAMLQDLKAAKRFLVGRNEVTQARIGIAGASLGATLAAMLAADDATIRSLALLSPSLDYRGLRIEPAMRKVGSRPVLLAASSEDAYALRSARELQKDATTRELQVLTSAGHGTTMLTKSPELLSTLVDWFRRTLL
jgi:alpha-beta hydrolase superfamily lysophospholipase